jgi:glutaredoxin
MESSSTGVKNMIVIYGTQSCSWCKKATELASDYNLEFEYRDVETNQEWQNELLKAVPNCNTIPQIVWHDKVIGGYEQFASEIENTRNFGDGPV